jgi:hypothetical protein
MQKAARRRLFQVNRKTDYLEAALAGAEAAGAASEAGAAGAAAGAGAGAAAGAGGASFLPQAARPITANSEARTRVFFISGSLSCKRFSGKTIGCQVTTRQPTKEQEGLELFLLNPGL